MAIRTCLQAMSALICLQRALVSSRPAHMPSVAPMKEVPTAAGGCSESPTLTHTGTPHFSSPPLHSHPCPGRPRLSLPQYSPTRDSPASYVPCRPAHGHLPAPWSMHTHTPSPGSPLTPGPDSLAIKSRQVPRSNTDASAPSIVRGAPTAADIPAWPQWAGTHAICSSDSILVIPSLDPVDKPPGLSIVQKTAGPGRGTWPRPQGTKSPDSDTASVYVPQKPMLFALKKLFSRCPDPIGAVAPLLDSASTRALAADLHLLPGFQTSHLPLRSPVPSHAVGV